MRQPSLYVPHGAGPCFFMHWDPPNTWDKHRQFLENIPSLLPKRPDAVIVVSAHWEANHFAVQANPTPGLLFDYHGFPEETYQLQWPARGEPELAMEVSRLLKSAGLPTALDTTRGYDHGVFVPMKVAFPSPDIPFIQLSLHTSLDPELHYRAGVALSALRDRNILLIGSGNTFHNIPVLLRGIKQRADSASGKDFDDWLTKTLTTQAPAVRKNSLLRWTDAPSARYAQPREEHLAPLFVIAGSAENAICRRIFEDMVLGAVESAFLFEEIPEDQN